MGVVTVLRRAAPAPQIACVHTGTPQWHRLERIGLIAESASKQHAAFTQALNACLHTPLHAVITSRDGLLEYYLGSAAPDTLIAHLPGTRTHPGRAPDKTALFTRFIHGVPRSPAPHAPGDLATLVQPDGLYRAMLHHPDWRITLTATPVHASELEGAIRDLQQRHNQATRSRQQGLEFADAALQQQREALERLHWLTCNGAWSVQIAVSADTVTALESLTRAVIAAWTPARATLEPIRTSPNPISTVIGSHELMGYLLQPQMLAVPGLNTAHEPRFHTQPTSATADALTLGRLDFCGVRTALHATLEPDHLTRHAFVTGQTRYGKTNTVRTVLGQLSQRGTPYLVIEPAKSEYRTLPNSTLYTIGHPEAPLSLNPFSVPNGVTTHTHIDRLVALFTAAFGLPTPLPAFLKKALTRLYAGQHRDIHTLLQHCIDAVAQAEYSPNVQSDITGALITRLETMTTGSLRDTLNPRINGDEGALFTRPTVIELEHLGNDGDKAFVMGLLLQKLRSHLEQRPRDTRYSPHLRHLCVIEEAHRLLQASPANTTHEHANPQAQAVQSFAHLLAEVGAYGQGIMIVEQIPSKLIGDVIKNTATKIVHRLEDGQERQLIAQTLGLTPVQTEVIGRLHPGQAVIRTPDAPLASLVHVTPGAL